MTTTLPSTEAVRRIRADHDGLLRNVEHLTENQARRPSRLADGPLGHFCDTLHDLLAHVLMWSEIGLAVLHDARAGRKHWSVDPRWETPEIGSALNRSGVTCGRELPTALLIERFVAVRGALTDEIEVLPTAAWDDPPARTGATLQGAMTPPGAARHAALHLGRSE